MHFYNLDNKGIIRHYKIQFNYLLKYTYTILISISISIYDMVNGFISISNQGGLKWIFQKNPMLKRKNL